MLSRKETTLCLEDDVAAKLLINNIFGDKLSNMDFPQFCNAIKYETPMINTVIRSYFGGKFTNSLAKIRLPELSDKSDILND